MSEALCPLIQNKKHEPQPCIKERCMWYMRVIGTDPNTGNPAEELGCAVAWMPTLLIENTQQVRQHGAATEGLRNRAADMSEAISKLNPNHKVLGG